MDKYSHLLNLVSLLRKSAPKFERFNVFSVLRSDSDEVRLHSRFIGALIDPDYHDLGNEILRALIGQIDIRDFSFRGVKVFTEKFNIDILITNADKKAIIIENKIYAGDQSKQIKTYYQKMLEEGFSPIYIRYLTLNGRLPTEQSIDGLDKELDSLYIQPISYAAQIRSWLDDAGSIAANYPFVRESVFQYKSVVDKLTANDQESTYMKELVPVLLSGKNMLLAKDIRSAYRLALGELQNKLWLDIIAAFEGNFIKQYEKNINKSIFDDVIRAKKIDWCYQGSRGNMNYGLYFRVPGYEDLTVGVEIEGSLFIGAFCDRGLFMDEYNRALIALQDIPGPTAEGPWVKWHYISSDSSLLDPNAAFMELLLDDQKRGDFANRCANEVINLWNLLAQDKNF